MSAVLVHDADGVRTLTLNRPEARNALDEQMIRELDAALRQILADGPETVRACVIRGMGGTFCAGGDLKGFAAVRAGEVGRDEIAAGNRAGAKVFDAFTTLPCVTIAAVEGAAMGGGVGLAAIADITLATERTRFQTTETTLGLIPAQIAIHLVDRLGRHRARRLLLSGRAVLAEEAVRIGLVDEVVADAAALEDAVAAIVAGVRRCAPRANAVTKALVDDALFGDRAGYADRAAARFAEALTGDEARAGLTAFLERTRPPWNPESSAS